MDRADFQWDPPGTEAVVADRATTGRVLSAVVLLGAFLTSLGSFSAAALASRALFDKPLKVTRLALPRDPQNPRAKTQLSCFYFPHFMVKQIDLGEIGADQLSIIPLPNEHDKIACRRSNSANEKVVASDEWSGYFEGVKGDYVFFNAEDGWNGGLGFAVFWAADGKKIFDDVAKNFRAIELAPSGITMRYERVFAASCSLRADETGCWRQIRHDTGLSDASPPNCIAAYDRERKRTPAFAQQVITDPTVIDYEVVVAIAANTKTRTPVTGKATACKPAD